MGDFLESNDDVVIAANVGGSLVSDVATGDIIFKTSDSERGRLTASGVGTGLFSTPGLPNWWAKLAADPANAKIVFLGDSTSYEPNDQRLFVRFRPNVTTTNGSHTLPTGTITVASTSGAAAAGTITVGTQTVTYTGTSATTFTGCTGGTGVIASGTKVVFATTYDTVHTAPGGDLYGMTADDSHIINGGNNGVKLADWLTGSGTYTLTNLFADNPDLIVFDWGINDVRIAVDTYTWQTLRDLIIVAVSRIRAGLPNADIILRMAGPASTDDVSGLHYITSAAGAVNPANGAQQFTDTLRKAYRALQGKWPNVVVWDSQARVFGSKAIASTNTNLWSTQIHPSAYGYALTADYLVNDYIALPGTGRRLAPLAPLQSYGVPVGDGIATTTATPYTVDASALDDTNVFQLIYAGEYNTQAASSLTVGNANNVVDWPLGYPLDVQNGDVVRLPDGVCYKIAGATVTTQASGAAIPNLLITGQSIPANTSTNGVVRIYRELSQGDRLMAKIRASVGSNRFVRVGRVQSGGTNNAVITAEPVYAAAVPSGQWPVRPTDSIYIAGGGANPVSLAAYTFGLSGAHLQLLTGTTFDFTNFVGRIVVIVGAHAGETTGDHLQTQSVVAGTIAATATADFTVTYTGARFAKPYNTVIAQPQSAVAAGVTWSAYVSAADTITLRFCNPTAAGVVVGTLNWDFWLIR